MIRRLSAVGAAAARAASRQPASYREVWLLAALGLGVPALVIFSVLGFLNGWTGAWPQITCIWPPAGLALYGAAGSIGLRRRLGR